MGSTYRNSYSIPEDVLSKPNFSEDTTNHASDNKQCILKSEGEHGLGVGNGKLCLDVSPKHLLSDEKAILPPVLYMSSSENVIDLEDNKPYSRTRCTSANVQNKNRRPLRRSHTTVIEPLQSSTTVLWKKTNRQGNKAAGNLNNEEDSEQPQCNIFHQSSCDIINVKERTPTYEGTVSHTPQQKLSKNTVIRRNDKTPLNTNSSLISSSVKQCW